MHYNTLTVKCGICSTFHYFTGLAKRIGTIKQKFYRIWCVKHLSFIWRAHKVILLHDALRGKNVCTVI